MIYLDTSAAAKLFLPESGTERVKGYLRSGETIVSSALLRTELIRTLVRSLDSVVEHTLIPDYVDALLPAITLISVSDPILSQSEGILGHSKTLDALHIATALSVNSPGDPVKILTFDKNFASCAKRCGFDVLET